MAETEGLLNTAQGRLLHVEANFAELDNERARLTGALEEANERHAQECSNQNTRFEALQACANTIEKLLGEAHDHLTARGEEIRGHEKLMNALALERNALQIQIAKMESEREELEQARGSLIERGAALTLAITAKKVAL